jgi:hypothetical protein
MSTQDWISDQLWPFARGDTPPREFEAWAYQAAELEAFLPEELYLEVVSLDYGDEGSVFTLRQRLAEFARRNSILKCECRTLPNLADVAMGAHEHVFRSIDELARRGEPFWWLSVNRCRECGQWWLVASEERINDVFLLRRLTDGVGQAAIEQDKWPSEFDRFSTLLRLGHERGHRWRFVDPMSPGLVQTAIDLANEMPELDTASLANLLQIDVPHANALAKRAEAESPIRIIRSPGNCG